MSRDTPTTPVMRTPTVTQPWRFPAILALSVLLSAPAMGQVATHPEALVDAGLRYLAAFTLSWLGVAAIGRLVDGYAAHNLAAREARLEVERTEAEQAEAARAGEVADDETTDLSSHPAMS